jgi:hypothetical protein
VLVALAAAGGAGVVGCGADDNAAPPIVIPPQDSSIPDTAVIPDAGFPVAVFSPDTPITFPLAACGQTTQPQLLTVTNNGTATLAMTMSSSLPAVFQVGSTLSVAPGTSATISLKAVIPQTAAANVDIQGFLSLFTNDPAHPNKTIQLIATPTGATLAFAPGSPMSFAFPSSGVGTPAPAQTVTLVNSGNAPGTFTFGAPADSDFSIDPSTTTATLMPSETWTVRAGFTAKAAGKAGTTAAVEPPNQAVCGATLGTISFSGEGVTGAIKGWPSAPMDFGLADCGGSAGAGPLSFTLTNSGAADVHLTSVSLVGDGFGTTAAQGATVAANGSTTFQVTAPPVPQNAPLTPITASLTIQTDLVNDSPHSIQMTEEPQGAVLSFDQSAPLDFGSVTLLQASATKTFNVINKGTAAANIALAFVAASDAGAPSFKVSPTRFRIPAGGSTSATQQVGVTFMPQAAGAATGAITLKAAGPVCSPPPDPIAVTGSGLGGGPSVVPGAITFNATCGGGTPQPQSFLVRNNGTADFTWNLTLGPNVQMAGADAGPDAARDATADTGAAAAPLYTISASPAPGLLIPGATSTVTVTGTAVLSPALNPDPAAFATQVTVTTDVPLDPPHVVTLGEIPVGDQLSLSLSGPLRFGQVPVSTPIAQTFTVVNNANEGSTPANVSLVLSGSGAAGYTVVPSAVGSLGPAGGAPVTETVTFTPTSAIDYPATLGIQTTDPLCTALPASVPVSGTGTNGQAAISTSSLTFGTDPHDSAGLVNCASTGPVQTFTVSNHGNQAFNLTGLKLGKDPSSPFNPVTASTMMLGIGVNAAPATITVTPRAIPATVADPTDAAKFSDTLTVTTDIQGDSPHVVNLVMQARGTVISNTSIATTWDFGTVSYGSIGTFTSSLQNTGNAPATIALTGLAQPSIFTLLAQPVTAPGNGPGGAYTPITGEFIPPSANGSWSDKGALVITAPESFCGPPPTGWTVAAGTAQPQWVGPSVAVSGLSNSSPPVTIAGSLAFPATDCGGGATAAQGVTLTNQTNVSYPYSVSFSSGKYYTLSVPADGGSVDAGTGHGVLAANGTATVNVQPNTIAPGPGVVPGPAPYGDNLLVTVQNPGGAMPIATFTVPISWALNGAVLSLPTGFTLTDSGGNAYYPADSTGGFTLPVKNSGNETAGVSVDIVPSGSVTLSPTMPIQVNLGASTPIQLTAASSDVACSPNGTAAPAVTAVTATFLYTGAVCQPLPVSSVTIGACSGTFPTP